MPPLFNLIVYPAPLNAISCFSQCLEQRRVLLEVKTFAWEGRGRSLLPNNGEKLNDGEMRVKNQVSLLTQWHACVINRLQLSLVKQFTTVKVVVSNGALSLSCKAYNASFMNE